MCRSNGDRFAAALAFSTDHAEQGQHSRWQTALLLITYVDVKG
jgi:hypothetical protein